MTPSQYDKIILKDLTYECRLGFHRVEKDIKQKISIDLEASVKPLTPSHPEKISAIRMDYFKANNLIRDLLLQKNYKLIETAAEQVALLVLDEFDVQAVEVRVTKYPLDMKNTGSVTYCCRRER